MMALPHMACLNIARAIMKAVEKITLRPSEQQRSFMDIPTLDEQERRLVFVQFSELTALDLGRVLMDLARAGKLPVVIDIRTPDRTLFHAAMPGATALNDTWARRKSNATLMWQASSLLIGTKMREKGDTLANNGLAEADYAVHGGSFPVRVQGVGVVAAVTVSGLPQIEDHALVVRALEVLLSARRPAPDDSGGA